MRHFISALVMAILFCLAGCGTTSGPSSSVALYHDKHRTESVGNQIRERGGDMSQLFYLDIPDAENGISNQLTAGLIKAGMSTNAMDTLLTLLRSVPVAQVVIQGNSDAITAASIEGVLKLLSPSTNQQKTKLWVTLKNPSEYNQSLLAAAQTAGVRLETLRFP